MLKKIFTQLSADLKAKHINLFDLVAYSLFFLFSYWLMATTLSYEPGKIVTTSRLWSDFGAHIPLIRSFSMGNNFPPEYATFPFEPIRYHYLFYLMAGLLEKAGFNLPFAVNFFSILGFFILLTMIYKITKLMSRSRVAGFLAVILFLFNGSFTWLEYLKTTPFGPALWQKIITAKHFASFGPWGGQIVAAFWHLNVYTNQRHIGLSFATSLVLIWPLLEYSFNKKNILNKWWVLFIMTTLAFFPLLHQAAYMMTLIFVFWFFIFHLPALKIFGPLYFFAFLYSLPCFLALPSSNSLRFYLGYLAKDRTIASTLEYWFYNLGLYSLLCPLIFLKADYKIKKFLFIFFLYFLLANLFWLSPDIINNHKLVNMFIIGLNIVVAPVLVKTFQKSLFHKLLVVILFFFLILGGIVDFFPIYNDYEGGIEDYQKSDIGTYIKNNTPPKAVFLPTTPFYNPASLVGRKIYFDYGYFNFSMGYDDHQRREIYEEIMSPDNTSQKLCALLKQNNLDYILISPGTGSVSTTNPWDSFLVKNYQAEYTSKDNFKLYNVNAICPDFFYQYY